MKGLQMSSAENKASVRQLFEAINRQDLSAWDELIADNYLPHSLPPGMPATRESQRSIFATLFSAFPDYRVAILDLIAEGEKVVAHVQVQGTHRGIFFGIQPTGKQITWTAVDIFHFARGKIIEYWLITDNLNVLQQLELRSRRDISQPAGADNG
jgi:steroid delta-isomerase-like uncharacterized protein